MNSTSSSDASEATEAAEAADVPLVTVTECVACELCAHGWGAARACSPTQNTVCRKCPSGTFSSVLDSSLACSICSVCRDDQVTLHDCTPIQDTVCAGSNHHIHSIVYSQSALKLGAIFTLINI